MEKKISELINDVYEERATIMKISMDFFKEGKILTRKNSSLERQIQEENTLHSNALQAKDSTIEAIKTELQ